MSDEIKNCLVIKLKGPDVPFPVPSTIPDLLSWHDFSEKTNEDEDRGIVADKSGNNRTLILNNKFTYSAGSGYENGGLQFNGIDNSANTNPDFLYPAFAELGGCTFVLVFDTDENPQATATAGLFFKGWPISAQLTLSNSSGQWTVKLNGSTVQLPVGFVPFVVTRDGRVYDKDMNLFTFNPGTYAEDNSEDIVFGKYSGTTYMRYNHKHSCIYGRNLNESEIIRIKEFFYPSV
jgi:hypothetical protein